MVDVSCHGERGSTNFFNEPSPFYHAILRHPRCRAAVLTWNAKDRATDRAERISNSFRQGDSDEKAESRPDPGLHSTISAEIARFREKTELAPIPSPVFFLLIVISSEIAVDLLDSRESVEKYFGEGVFESIRAFLFLFFFFQEERVNENRVSRVYRLLKGMEGNEL